MKTKIEDYQFYLTLMHDQVKYAEGKNAAIIVFSGGALIGLINSIDSIMKVLDFTIFGYSLGRNEKLLKLSILIFCVGLFFSIIISILSFIPKVKGKIVEMPKVSNILFFNSNTQFKSGIELKKYYSNRYLSESCLTLDYCNQIRNLSIIAKRKYNYFKYSLFPILIAFVVVMLLCIISLL